MPDDVLYIEARSKRDTDKPVITATLNGKNITQSLYEIGIVTRDVCGGPVDYATVNGKRYPVLFQPIGPQRVGPSFARGAGGVGSLLWTARTPDAAMIARLAAEEVAS